MYKGLKQTNFNFPQQTGFYRGKVRDVYYFGQTLVMVATDRISAFDVILPHPIPYKGQVLNQVAVHFLEHTKDICPNWLTISPDPHVSIGIVCEPYKVEMVVRGYLSGHAWRTYQSGLRTLCGVTLPDGLKESDKLPVPIITPSTKAAQGHDEDISKDEIIAKAIVPAKEYEVLEKYALKLYERGTQMAEKQGLILVDTKYEFGKYNGDIVLIDEIHTPDSSRYFYLDGYQARQHGEEPQKQLSKEFVRKWLIENGFQGKDGQKVPDMGDDFIQTISDRYVELYEKVTGKKFIPSDYQNIEKRIENSVLLHFNNRV
ncbi:MAG: phosphoribosylaminoimidazolesuccinocarboxamide synthase [Cytophagales bacterium]|nr:phosphoribosylaminoimidazolesuccinocarboxamide synthase [Cytophagales bacterium]